MPSQTVPDGKFTVIEQPQDASSMRIDTCNPSELPTNRLSMDEKSPSYLPGTESSRFE